jgi:DNA mismatch repair protein MutL
MGSSIQPLNVELIYRIAAGEVIDSLNAVVRELIDNALDAGATRLQISLWPREGRVQVADNGRGMAWADLLQAALPHTTSKIDTFHHLGELATLGFRGEALHSLAQLGHLEICSRTQDGATGWRVAYTDQGAIAQAEEIALAAGTTINVTQLFQNWPSRQDALAKPQQAMQSIQAMIGDYALCHPHVTWQISQSGRDWFSLAPGSPKDLLLQLLRKLSPDDLHYNKTQIDLAQVDLELAAPDLSDTTERRARPETGTLELLTGLPDRLHRQRADWVRVAVNGRRVSVNTDAAPESWGLGPLEQSILNAFRQTVPRHRYPLCWVHLRVPSCWVDWNRTASKSHIYLHQVEYWREKITQQIHRSLHFTDQAVQSTQLPQLFRSAEQQGRYALAPVNLSSPLPNIGSDDGSEDTRTSKTSDLDAEMGSGQTPEQGNLRAIAQLRQTYILAEHPTGLWLIEQHIAHERVLYEQICENWQILVLESPIMLRNLTEQQVQNLTQMGLAIEPFGQTLWAARTAPQLLAQRSDCSDALYELSHCVAVQPALVATACRSALKNGQALTLSEMQILLNQWQQTRNPRTCPHGRPIYLALEEQALSRFFRRHWVIGKSHGL